MADTDSSHVDPEDAKHALQAQTLRAQLEQQRLQDAQDAQDRLAVVPRVSTTHTLPRNESVPSTKGVIEGMRLNLTRDNYGPDDTMERRQDEKESVSARERDRDGGGGTRRHKSRRSKTNRRRSKTNRRSSKTNRRRRKH